MHPVHVLEKDTVYIHRNSYDWVRHKLKTYVTMVATIFLKQRAGNLRISGFLWVL